MRILRNRFVRLFVVPQLLAGLAVGPVWATDYSGTDAVIRSNTAPNNQTDIINVNGDLDVTGADAITIESTGTAAGITVNQGFQVTSTSARSIQINSGGILGGTITNAGHIDDGITISGNITEDGVISVENTAADGEASIHGGIIINSSSVVSSSSTDTVSIGDSGYIDYINVESGSSLTNTGSGHAINVTSLGQLGGSFNNNDLGGSVASITRIETDTILDIDGTVSAGSTSAINIGTDISATSGVPTTGKIDISGTVSGQEKTTSAGTEKGAISIDGNYLGTLEVSGTVNDAIVIGGSHNATGNAIETTSTAILGNSAGEVILQIKDGASLSSTNGKSAVLGGTINGSIINDGSITDGLEITGTQTSTGPAYESNDGDLTGGYIVSGTVNSSSATATVLLNGGATMDRLEVTATNSLNNTGSGAAVVVDGAGSIIRTIVNAGTIDGNIETRDTASIGNGSDNGIENSGTIEGRIVNAGTIQKINSTGTINGGIDNTGTISGGVNLTTVNGGTSSAYSSTGTGSLTGGITIDGTVTSDNDTISIGTGSSLDDLTVTNGGNLESTHANATNAIKVEGEVTGTIKTEGTGTITGNINNEGTVNKIELTSQTSTGNVYSSAAGTLTDYEVVTGGTVSSSGATAISLGQASGGTGTITTVTINGELKANAGGTAINLDATGDIGNLNIAASGALGDATAKGGTISNGGSIGTITNAGNIYGDIENTGSGSITTTNSTGTLTGSIINSSSSATGIGSIAVENQDAGNAAAYTSSGSAKLGSYTVNGTVTTTGADAVSIGAGSEVDTITISNDANAKLVGGTNAINVAGSVTNGITNNGTVEGDIITTGTGTVGAINNNGVLKGDINVNSGTSITNGITSTGTTFEGAISNSGDIDNGITISDQTATGQAYLGTSGSTLDGGYNVQSASGTGVVTSTGSHTFELQSGGRVDAININSGSLTSQGASQNAIQLNDGSLLHDGSEDVTETVISIANGATVEALGSTGVGINIETDVTGRTAIAGTLAGDGAALRIASSKTYTGQIEIQNGGRVTDPIEVDGTHTADADTLHIANNGALIADNASETILSIDGTLKTNTGTGVVLRNEGLVTGALDINSTGSVEGQILNAGTWTGNIEVNSGGSLTGTINNTGTFTGDILVNGSHAGASSAESVYYSKGVDDSNKATMTGGYKLGNSQTVTTTVDTLFVDEYSELGNVTVESGSTLKSTGTNKSAVLIAENASLIGTTGSETDNIMTIDGDLLSDQGAALNVQGNITGTILVGSTGLIQGKGGSTDAAILLDSSNSSPVHEAAIDNRGVIKGRIYIDTNQSLTSKAAYSSIGSSSNWAVLTGVADEGRGYTIDTGATVTSGTTTVNIGDYAYVDSMVVSGKLTSTGGNAIYVDSNGQLGGTLLASQVAGGRVLADITRTENDTVINIEDEVSSTTDYAIKLDGNAAGAIKIDNGATLSGKADSHGSIQINGIYLGQIQNKGVINGDIVVTGQHGASSGALLHTLDGSSSDFNHRYLVKSGGQAISAAGTEIIAENESHIEEIEVESGGVLGQEASETLRVASGATVNDVTNSGTLAGSILVTGTDSKIGTVTVNVGGRSRAAADHNLQVVSGGVIEKIVINGTDKIDGNQIGLLTATGDNKNAVHIASGASLGTTESAQTLVVDGQLTAFKGNTVELAGNSIGEINIGQYGLIYAEEADDSAIHISGAHTGKIMSAGAISSGITVTGTHTSTLANSAAYEAEGVSSTDMSVLTGGYKVSGGGSVSSASDTVHLKNHSSVDVINVVGSGSTIETTGAANSAIFIDTGSVVGTAVTTNAVSISDGGLVTGSNNAGSAAIKANGTVNGMISVSNGGLLGSHSGAHAIDFSGATTALNFVQTGASSATKGLITGRSVGEDTVSIREGSFTGNISNIEHLIISDDSFITMTGGFILPKKTTVYLDAQLDSGRSLITTDGSVAAHGDGSEVSFTAETPDAYRNLYLNGPVVTVVDADSIQAGTLDLVTVNSGSALLQVEKYADGNDIKVRIEASTSEDIDGVLGNALLAALDPNADQTKATQILDALNNNGDVIKALEEDVRPDTTGYTHKAPREMALATQTIIFDRINSSRSGMNFGDDGFGFGLYGNSYDDDGRSSDREEQAQGEDDDLNRDRHVRQMDYTLINGGTFWGQMMYLEGTQDQKTDTDGYSNRAGGVILGIDSIVLDSFRFGLAATYGFGVVNTETGRSTESHNFMGTVYSSWEEGGYFVDTMFTLGTGTNDTSKTIDSVSGNNKVTGSYTSRQWNLRSMAGYRFELGENWEFTPMLDLNYGSVRFDTYDEKGTTGTEQKIEIQQYSALELGLGFRLRGVFHNGKSYVEPDFTLMSYRDLNSSGSSVKYSFLAGGPEALIEGPERDNQRYHASFGMYFDLGGDWFVRTAYDYRWSNTYRSHGLNAKFRYHY